MYVPHISGLSPLGFSAWACYAIVGLALGFFSYSRAASDDPIWFDTAFGNAFSGTLGHVIDIVSVIMILGVAVTIGYGVSQFTPVSLISRERSG